ncbi:hypothetical protein Ahia01_000858600, partial [Argonauta hians]
GHGWGAEHDPNKGDCSPSVADGGKYVMFPHSVRGNNPNNYKFSRCSKLIVKGVLLALSQLCFKAQYIMDAVPIVARLLQRGKGVTQSQVIQKAVF